MFLRVSIIYTEVWPSVFHFGVLCILVVGRSKHKLELLPLSVLLSLAEPFRFVDLSDHHRIQRHAGLLRAVHATTKSLDGLVVLFRDHLRRTQAKISLGLQGLGLVEGTLRFVRAFFGEFLPRQDHSLFRGKGFECVQRESRLCYRTSGVLDLLMREARIGERGNGKV